MDFDYLKLIGHCYYEENIPIGIIEQIVKTGDHYMVYLDHTKKSPFLKIKCPRIFIINELNMLKLYKDLIIREERKNLILSKNITKLVHFTKLENLDNILEYGLLSNNILNEKSISYLKSDEFRLDNKLDFICNSISFPNYKMFYYKRNLDLNQKWVILTIKPAVLIHKLDTEFYKTNRATSTIYLQNNNYITNKALEDLFEEDNRDPKIPTYYTTNPQAEVLVKNNIQTPYIFGVESNGYIDKVKSLTKNVNIDYNPNSSLFNGRIDYGRWKNGN